MLLTRLPAASATGPWPEPAACVWAYPLVGLVVGAASASVLFLSRRCGLSDAVAAVLAVAVAALATGGLHEDGLADTADALSGGRTVGKRLLILRDSRIGAHGALALALALVLRIAALATAPTLRGTVLAVLAAAVTGRAAMLPILLFARPARPDGLGASLARATPRALVAGIALALVVGWVLAPASLPVAAVTSLLGVIVARRRFDGYTGDLLGAVETVTEAAVLVVLSAA